MSGHLGRIVVAAIELALLTAIIFLPRCANHEEVFIAGNVYFTDADCYARMTRVRMCLAHPGTIVRHHDFENFPQGTTPHTTAPFDYLVVALALLFVPFTSHALDLAGAIVSPFLALMGGWFLWWWARKMKFRYRWPTLIVFAVSPILVHGTALGRPDHQSLLIVLLMIALCAEWSLLAAPSRGWSIVAGCAWGLALWVSLYEPLILFLLFLGALSLFSRHLGTRLFGKTHRFGWWCFLFWLATALMIERRIPPFLGLTRDPFVRNWTRGIGELHPVSLRDPIWFQWAGYLLVLLPLLFWWQRRKYFARTTEARALVLFLGLLGAIFLLTMWQARWGYFFVSMFLILLPSLLQPFRWRGLVWAVFVLSLWPMARAWDSTLWPGQTERTERAAVRIERVNLRELALAMRSPDRQPFLAPWWLSPALAFWSEQPGVAGSSHESIAGIVESARFYASDDLQETLAIMENHHFRFVLGYDADRTAESSGQILGQAVSKHAMCFALARGPARPTRFLVPLARSPAGQLFQIVNNR